MTNICRFSHCFLFYLLTVTIAPVIIGCNAQSLSEPVDIEVVAQKIDKSLICPICPSETIDQSQTAIAKQMKSIVREKLRAGQSDKEILDYFVDRYGLGILSEPPKSGLNLMVWVIPPIGLSIGITILVLTIISMKKDKHATENAQSLEDHQINQYLLQVDTLIEKLSKKHQNISEKDEDIH